MIASIAFPFIAVCLVLFAGRKDAARDPSLTFLLLILSALLPLLSAVLPKIPLISPVFPIGNESGYSWGRYLIAIWVLGSLYFLAKLVGGLVMLKCWQKRAESIGELDGVKILLLEGLKSPVAAGMYYKLIFVPLDWGNWAESDRQIALSHELAHHRSRDPLRRLCAELARAVLWFHPLAHWMMNRLSIQCEYACDEAVIRNGISSKRYAELLCSMAETSGRLTFVIAMAEQSSLEKRVRRMCKLPLNSARHSIVFVAILGVLAAFALSIICQESASLYQNEALLRLGANPFPGER